MTTHYLQALVPLATAQDQLDIPLCDHLGHTPPGIPVISLIDAPFAPPEDSVSALVQAMEGEDDVDHELSAIMEDDELNSEASSIRNKKTSIAFSTDHARDSAGETLEAKRPKVPAD
eukprot:3698742-Pyramimonas_sp.AAC.1